MALAWSILVRAQTAPLGVTSLLCISHLHVFISKLTATNRRMIHTWFCSCWSMNSEAYDLSVICSCCLFVDKILIAETRFQLTLCAASAHIIMLLTQIEPVEFSLDWLVNHFLLLEEPQICVSSHNEVCIWASYWMVCLTTEICLYVSHKCCEMRAYIQVFLGIFMKFFQRNHIADHQ